MTTAVFTTVASGLGLILGLLFVIWAASALIVRASPFQLRFNPSKLIHRRPLNIVDAQLSARSQAAEARRLAVQYRKDAEAFGDDYPCSRIVCNDTADLMDALSVEYLTDVGLQPFEPAPTSRTEEIDRIGRTFSTESDINTEFAALLDNATDDRRTHTSAQQTSVIQCDGTGRSVLEYKYSDNRRHASAEEHLRRQKKAYADYSAPISIRPLGINVPVPTCPRIGQHDNIRVGDCVVRLDHAVNDTGSAFHYFSVVEWSETTAATEALQSTVDSYQDCACVAVDSDRPDRPSLRKTGRDSLGRDDLFLSYRCYNRLSQEAAAALNKDR